MPELPEVETVRRGLAPVVEGRVLRRLEVLDARWCAPLGPQAVSDAVEGRRIEALTRRGKYLTWTFTDEVHLVTHLRMTGSFLIDPRPDEPYQRVVMDLGAPQPAGTGTRCEAVVRFCDPRRFGTGELLLGDDALAAFYATRLGIEPLSGALTGVALRARARGRRAPVKAFLLDQRHVAGVGNIYADEALHRAGVHPLRCVHRLTAAQWDALAVAVREALEAGLAAGGATIDDFRHADGVLGAFQDELRVHRRRGEPCGTCGRSIIKFVVAGRGTYACEGCQPRPRRARRP